MSAKKFTVGSIFDYCWIFLCFQFLMTRDWNQGISKNSPENKKNQLPLCLVPAWFPVPRAGARKSSERCRLWNHIRPSRPWPLTKTKWKREKFCDFFYIFPKISKLERMAYFGRHTESFNASRTIKIPSTETVENYTVSGKIKIKKGKTKTDFYFTSWERKQTWLARDDDDDDVFFY